MSGQGLPRARAPSHERITSSGRSRSSSTITRRRCAVSKSGATFKAASQAARASSNRRSRRSSSPRRVWSLASTGLPGFSYRIASSRSRKAAARCAGVWSSRSCCDRGAAAIERRPLGLEPDRLGELARPPRPTSSAAGGPGPGWRRRCIAARRAGSPPRRSATASSSRPRWNRIRARSTSTTQRSSSLGLSLEQLERLAEIGLGGLELDLHGRLDRAVLDLERLARDPGLDGRLTRGEAVQEVEPGELRLVLDARAQAELRHAGLIGLERRDRRQALRPEMTRAASAGRSRTPSRAVFQSCRLYASARPGSGRGPSWAGGGSASARSRAAPAASPLRARQAARARC